MTEEFLPHEGHPTTVVTDLLVLHILDQVQVPVGIIDRPGFCDQGVRHQNPVPQLAAPRTRPQSSASVVSWGGSSCQDPDT